MGSTVDPDADTDEDLRAAVSAHLPILPVLSAQLRQTASQIERSVVEVCNSFDAIAARTQANVTRTTHFLGHQADGGGERVDIETLIEASRETVEALLDRLVRASDQSACAIDKLREVDLARARIVKAIEGLADIAAGNKILAVNARVQAAYLGATGAGIGAVANEISAHSKQSTEIAKSIVTISNELTTVLGSAVRDLEEMAGADRRSMETSREEVQRTMRQFRTTLDSTREFIGVMVAEGEALTSEIYAAVRGLQFQDRTNQRISHVTDEMDRIHGSLSDCLGSAGDAGEAGSLVADLARHYTMAEERQLAGADEEVTDMAGEAELF